MVCFGNGSKYIYRSVFNFNQAKNKMNSTLYLSFMVPCTILISMFQTFTYSNFEL